MVKKFFFPIFITIISLLSVYLFYTFWHTPASSTSETSLQSHIPSSQKIPTTPKDIFHLDNNRSIESDLGEMLPEEMEQKQQVSEATSLPMSTTQEQERQTQEIYEALTPEEHEETLSEAQEAFDQLDQTVIELDEKLALEMEAVEQSRIEAGEPAIDEIPTESADDTIETHEEVIPEEPSMVEEAEDPSLVDVNNL